MAIRLVWSSIALILAGAVFATNAVSDAPISVAITPLNETVFPGTNVTITCYVKITEDITEGTLVYIKKVVNTNPGNRDGIVTETITTLTTVGNPYKNLGRFAATRTTDHSHYVYSLTITGVKTEDSGTYSCSCPDIPDTYAAVPLRVYRPPAGISFPGYNDTTVVELTEGVAPTGLECLVSHVLPVPEMKLTVDGRDVTQDSLIATKINALCNNVGAVAKPCPLYQDENVTVTPREYHPVYTDDGKYLVCTSTMREFNRTVNSASVYLSVRYAPKISCAPLTVRVNTSNVVLICIVYANPFLPYNRTWIITTFNKNTTLKDSTDMNGQFRLDDRMDRSAHPKMANVTLTIPFVTQTFLKYKYYLQFENEIGTLTVPVQLKEELSVTPPKGMGSRLMTASGWTALTLMTSSLLLFFRHLL